MQGYKEVRKRTIGIYGTIGIMNGDYEPIWIPKELKKKIKTLAAKKGQTIIKFLEELLKEKWGKK